VGAVYRAVRLDPLMSAVLALDRSPAMSEELFAVHAPLIQSDAW